MIINTACCHFLEGQYEEACGMFSSAVGTSGYRPDLAYNIALCHYKMKQYGAALKHVLRGAGIPALSRWKQLRWREVVEGSSCHLSGGVFDSRRYNVYVLAPRPE